jgi:hypothetical protein
MRPEVLSPLYDPPPHGEEAMSVGRTESVARSFPVTSKPELDSKVAPLLDGLENSGDGF